jgi:hypothetical protein
MGLVTSPIRLALKKAATGLFFYQMVNFIEKENFTPPQIHCLKITQGMGAFHP